MDDLSEPLFKTNVVSYLKRTILIAVCLAILAVPFAIAQENDDDDPLLVRVDGKIGYIDRSGKIVIEPQFEQANEFKYGLAPVSVGNKWGFIDRRGEFAIDPIFDWIYWTGFNEGICPAGINGKKGGIDINGKFVIEPKYEMALKFADGLMPVQLTKAEGDYFEKWIYVDAKGQQSIDKEFFHAGSFVEGRTFVSVGFDEWALIDKSGKEVTKRHFDSNDPWNVFAEGLTAVKVKKKWGYIDRSGKFIIKPRFDNADNFSEGLAVVTVGCYDGYIDKSGKFVIPPRFETAGKFSGGLAAVAPEGDIPWSHKFEIKGKSYAMCGAGLGSNAPQGYIDKTGRMVIEPKFGRGFPFSNGIAMVSFDEPPDVLLAIGKRGYIDRTGNYIWQPTK